ncbi:M20/M25/M40 family metallo-hydrolase, partial [Sphingomonas bacterium]|uniref:M20/M25/M40 family metallo-hydrolase n=1 Tax=Sphingomonas bacterium TaxID=1895847 RepID=UPI0015775032
VSPAFHATGLMLCSVHLAATGGEVVATVGRIEASPGVANVIPGRADFTLDVRAPDHPARDATAAAILAEVEAIATRRGVTATVEKLQDLAASPCDPRMIDLLSRAVATVAQPVRRLASGAGHDAMTMAALCPTAMLFIRCAGGVSHNPAEAVDAADVEAAAQAMLRFVDLLGGSLAA